MSSSLILAFLALLLMLAKLFGGVSRRLGFPAVLGELLAGVVLGPTVFGVLDLRFFRTAAPAGTGTPGALIAAMAGVGVVILMFRAGLETDRALMKAAAGAAFWAASGGVILPLAGGTFLARAFGFGWSEAIFLGTVLTATSVSVTAQTLMDLKRLETRVGSTILGAAVIDDVLGLIVLSVVIAAEGGSGHAAWTGVGMTLGRLAVFILAAFLAGPPLLKWATAQTQRRLGHETLLAAGLAFAFLFAFLAEFGGGVAAITGAYLAGFFMAEETPPSKDSQTIGNRARGAGNEMATGLRAMTDCFFSPLFFASVGLAINGRHLGGRPVFFVLLLAVAALGKVLGCGAGAWFQGFRAGEALSVGVGMIPRGEVGLITASIGWGAGLISKEVYAMVVVLILATTLITPILLRMVFGQKGKRVEIARLANPPAPPSGADHGGGAGNVEERPQAQGLACSALLGALLTVALGTGCAVKKIAVNKIGDAIASGGSVYAADNDPALVRDAVPFSLKLMESLLEENPKHRGLLLAAAKGFTEYSYAFVEEDADEMESRDLESANRMHARARLLYLRARDYGLRDLEVRHRGFGKDLRENPKVAVARIRSRKEVPLLYWTAASWGLAISVSKDHPDLVADQPIVEALIDRALQLDEGFDDGAIHSFLISYEPSRQGAKGDPLDRSREHFQRAVELSHGRLAGPYVAFAETVSVQRQDRAEFEALLKEALAIDPDAQPETRLENLVEQQRARWLLARTEELFAQ